MAAWLPAVRICRWLLPQWGGACPNHCGATAAPPPPPTQARLDAETTFEGAPVRADLLPGTVFEVLVGHGDEMEERGHESHLVAHLGDSARGKDDTS